MLVMSLWMGQTALSESGLFSVAWGVATVTLACLSGTILAGVYEPEAIPDEELSSLASRILLAMLLIGVIVSLLLLFL
ncbi:MAG: hypothetical protein A07HB70_02375 [uncultured archaeon A07HB70]|nr:MAG: hypothetical protein A07HB70_02375 [uncultured archaeon A07HB70]